MYTDITKYEHAATLKGIDPNWRPDFSLFSASYQKAKKAEFELDIIIEQLNQEYINHFEESEKTVFPNWNDWLQDKWELWLEVQASDECTSGSGLSLSGVDSRDADASAGSRRLFVHPDVATYAFKTFYQLFVDSYLNNQ